MLRLLSLGGSCFQILSRCTPLGVCFPPFREPGPHLPLPWVCWPNVCLFVPPTAEDVRLTRERGPQGLALRPEFGPLGRALGEIPLRDPPLRLPTVGALACPLTMYPPVPFSWPPLMRFSENDQLV